MAVGIETGAPIPYEWLQYEDDTFDSTCAERYGWSLPQIDALDTDDRTRIQRWWITKLIVEDAYTFNRKFKSSADQYERLMNEDSP